MIRTEPFRSHDNEICFELRQSSIPQNIINFSLAHDVTVILDAWHENTLFKSPMNKCQFFWVVPGFLLLHRQSHQDSPDFGAKVFPVSLGVVI
jgi:hypothetical protein